jgi:hypothetical protein
MAIIFYLGFTCRAICKVIEAIGITTPRNCIFASSQVGISNSRIGEAGLSY